MRILNKYEHAVCTMWIDAEATLEWNGPRWGDVPEDVRRTVDFHLQQAVRAISTIPVGTPGQRETIRQALNSSS